MSSNYISGFIPDTLGNLRNLEILNLEVNNLASSGMSFLSSLTNCRGLQVSFDGNPLISGELPVSIGNLSGSLEELYVSACNVKGSIPAENGNLSRLILIEIGDNELTGIIPFTIGRLKDLQTSLSSIQ
ncbi:hypothetical protein V6N13_085151 [Hibiscus sabdariffa]|uniref:Uncharacterized protein n=1 Tax=Hibiscus sabdariffa TaxID=183260 RepID=A0ABR2D0Q1_9ROSI